MMNLSTLNWSTYQKSNDGIINRIWTRLIFASIQTKRSASVYNFPVENKRNLLFFILRVAPSTLANWMWNWQSHLVSRSNFANNFFFFSHYFNLLINGWHRFSCRNSSMIDYYSMCMPDKRLGKETKLFVRHIKSFLQKVFLQLKKKQKKNKICVDANKMYVGFD